MSKKPEPAPVSLARGLLLGETTAPLEMTREDFEIVLGSDAFTPDELMEIRHLERNRDLRLVDK